MIIDDPRLQRERLVVTQEPRFQPQQFFEQPRLFDGFFRQAQKSLAAKAMKLAAPFDELIDRLEEAEVGRIGIGTRLRLRSVKSPWNKKLQERSSDARKSGSL